MAKPQLPVAAQEYTVKGAEAFVRHYIELVNYAGFTGDTKQLRLLSLPRCGPCNSFASLTERQYERGGWVRGGRWTVDHLRTTRMTGKRVVLKALMTSAPQFVKETRSSKVKRYPAETKKPLYMTVAWTANQWLMVEFGS